MAMSGNAKSNAKILLDKKAKKQLEPSQTAQENLRLSISKIVSPTAASNIRMRRMHDQQKNLEIVNDRRKMEVYENNEGQEQCQRPRGPSKANASRKADQPPGCENETKKLCNCVTEDGQR